MTQEKRADSVSNGLELPVFVALDLETTGLDPQADEIIEVGAVRFQDARVLDLVVQDCGLQELVKPLKAIGTDISRLTGITQEMVRTEASWNEIVDKVQAFLDPPVSHFIAHNVRFEESFLAHKAINMSHLTLLDTYDMVHMFVPGASYAALEGVCHGLDIRLEKAHRAAHDALATGQLFMRLVMKLQALPDVVIQQVLAHTSSNWPYHSLFDREAVVRELASVHTNVPVTRSALRSPLQTHKKCHTRKVHPENTQSLIDSEAIWQALEPGSGTVMSLPCDSTYSQELAQICIQWAKEGNRHLLLCLPSFGEFSYQQLMIDALQIQAAEIAPGMPIAYRPNPSRLCDLGRLNAWKAGRTLDHYEIRFLAKVLHWCSISPPEYRRLNGLFLFSHDPAAHDGHVRWPLVAGTSDSVPAALEPGGDHFPPPESVGGAGAITLMDHDALLFALDADPDFARDFDGLIIDDLWHLFHQIPEASTQIVDLGSMQYLQERIRHLGPAGAGDEITDWLQQQPECPEAIVRMMDQLDVLEPVWHQFDETLQSTSAQHLATGQGLHEASIDQAHLRNSPAWSVTLRSWQNCVTEARALLGGLDALMDALPDIDADVKPDSARYIQQIRSLRREFRRVLEGMNRVLDGETGPQASARTPIKWLTLRGNGTQCEFKSTSLWNESYVNLHLRTAFETVLFLHRSSARGTSAQDFLSLQLGLSSFKHEKMQVTKYVPELQIVLPELPKYLSPSQVGHLVSDIAGQTQGCVLLLYTGRTALLEVAAQLEPLLKGQDIPLLIHNRDTGQDIANALQQPGLKLLCGTYDLLQDIALNQVDIQCAIITRIPFPPRSHPLRNEQSRISQPKNSDGNEFNTFVLPYVNTKLLRVVDHLIMPTSPRGSLVMLDSRFRQPYIRGNKQTGLKGMVTSWPRADWIYPPLARTASTVGEWLQGV